MFLDLHLLTNRYSEMNLLPIGAIHHALETGLDGVVLVEKNHLWSDEEIAHLRQETHAPEEFLILRAQEVECPEGKIVVIGVSHKLPDQIATFELKQMVRDNGGCAILIPESISDRDIMFSLTSNDPTHKFRLFDAVEIYNSALKKGDMRRFRDLILKHKITAVGGSCSTQSSLFATKIFDEIKNEKELAQAIINKRVRPVPIDGEDVSPNGGSNKKLIYNVPKLEMMNCKGLIFDLYGTLIDLKSRETYDEFNRMALWLSHEDIQVSGEMLRQYYISRCEYLYNKEREQIRFPEVDILQVFHDAINFFSGKNYPLSFAKKAAIVFRTLTVKRIALYPYARAVLRELKKRRYRMGIISNAQAAFTVPELSDLKLDKLFDFIILSSDVKCSKPDTLIYKIAARQIELPPEESVFIGDDLIGDIYGAKQSGFKTVYVKTNVGNSEYLAEPDVTLVDGDLRNLLRLFP